MSYVTWVSIDRGDSLYKFLVSCCSLDVQRPPGEELIPSRPDRDLGAQSGCLRESTGTTSEAACGAERVVLGATGH